MTFPFWTLHFSNLSVIDSNFIYVATLAEILPVVIRTNTSFQVLDCGLLSKSFARVRRMYPWSFILILKLPLLYHFSPRIVVLLFLNISLNSRSSVYFPHSRFLSLYFSNFQLTSHWNILFICFLMLNSPLLICLSYHLSKISLIFIIL